MNFALVYLGSRAGRRVADFFRHWYWDGSKVFFHRALSLLEELDRTFAVRVTLVHFFEPLYQDYSIVGRILGLIFRTGRALIGAAVYAAVVGAAALIYAAWLLVPPALFVYGLARL